MSALTALEIREMSNMLKAFFEKEYMEKIYPVGAVYISTQATNPSTLFGGTWERIRDRFLLSAGNTYTAGSTGGSADAVVVNHYHSVIESSSGNPIYLESGSSGGYLLNISYTQGAVNTAGKKLTTNSEARNPSGAIVGTTATGKNMPPYIAVYMWKRIA